MYTYGRNIRTHNAVLVLLKRTLTLYSFMEGHYSPNSVLKILKDDEQLHPLLQEKIKEALGNTSKNPWTTFWNDEEVFVPILRTIIDLGERQNKSLTESFRAALSLAAFEEGKLRDSRSLEEQYSEESLDDWLI